jgi:hypothetical protein
MGRIGVLMNIASDDPESPAFAKHAFLRPF